MGDAHQRGPSLPRFPPLVQPARQRRGRVRRRTFPGHHDDVGSPQRIPSLAPGPGRQRPGRGHGALGTHDGDVQVARHAEQLKRVVEHQHVRAGCAGLLCARGPVPIRHDHTLGDEPAVHQQLVRPVAAQQNAGRTAAPDVVARDPGRERGLSRAAHRKIPHGDRRQRQPLNSQCAAAIRRRPQPHRRTVEHREWDEWQPRDCGRSTRLP